MPLIKEWNTDDYSLAAIWHIEEAETFFAERTQLEINIKNDIRRMEKLAGRFLLQHVEKDFPIHDIITDEHDKPQLPGLQYHFSISHSYPYVAAVVSAYKPAGIDIQCWHPRIDTILDKFLSAKEKAFCEEDYKKMTIAWSAKEAAYKWLGRRGVDFKEHLPIVSWSENGHIHNIEINQHVSDAPCRIYIKGLIFNDYSICFVINK